jgi:hypothetical protein
VPRKKQDKEWFCGHCEVCKRELTSTNGNWIVTASKVHLCHEPCWDIHIKKKEEERRLKHEEDERKKKDLYGKKEFTEKEKIERKQTISKLESYLEELKNKTRKRRAYAID